MMSMCIMACDPEALIEVLTRWTGGWGAGGTMTVRQSRGLGVVLGWLANARSLQLRLARKSECSFSFSASARAHRHRPVHP